MKKKDLRCLKRTASNSTKSLISLSTELQLRICRATISRCLKSLSLHHNRIKGHPSLRKAHRAVRIKFSRKFMQQKWSKVWFTDEKKWCHFLRMSREPSRNEPWANLNLSYFKLLNFDNFDNLFLSISFYWIELFTSSEVSIIWRSNNNNNII